jgi:hypothetical protein
MLYEIDYFSCPILISFLLSLPPILLYDTRLSSEKLGRLLLKCSILKPCCNKTSKNENQRKDNISYMNHHRGKNNLRFVRPPLPQPMHMNLFVWNYSKENVALDRALSCSSKKKSAHGPLLCFLCQYVPFTIVPTLICYMFSSGWLSQWGGGAVG